MTKKELSEIYDMKTKDEVLEAKINGTHWVTLADILVIPGRNPRKKITQEGIAEKQRSLGDNRNRQQIQEVAATIHEGENGHKSILLYSGYTREEAMERNALKDLITQWNEENNLSSSDPEYIDPTQKNFGFEGRQVREQILNHSIEWAERYKEALRQYPIRINVGIFNEKETFVRSSTENLVRTDVSLSSRIHSIMQMTNAFKMKRKDIIAETGISQATISQLLSIGGIKGAMHEFYNIHFGAVDEANEKGKEIWDKLSKAIEEFERRLELPTKDECSIKMASGLHFNSFIKKAIKGKFKWSVVWKVFKTLTCLDENDNVNESTPSMSSPSFKHLIGVQEVVGNRVEDSVQNTEDLVKLQEQDETIDFQIEGLDNAQTDNESSAESSPEKEGETAPFETESGSEPEEAPLEIVGLDDDSDELELDDFNISIGDDDEEEEEEDSEDDISVELEAAGEAEKEESKEEEYTGERASKTKEAKQEEVKETLNWKAISEKLRVTSLLIQTELQSSPEDFCSRLFSLGELSALNSCIKQNDQSNAIDDIGRNLAEVASKLFQTLIEHASNTMTGDKYEKAVMKDLNILTSNEVDIDEQIKNKINEG